MDNFYTDLAMESGRIGKSESIPGIHSESEQRMGIHCLRVNVLDARGARETGRPVGTYVTLYADKGGMEGEARSAMRAMLIKELRRLCGAAQTGGVLVLGLGNRQVTPDALGPRAADLVLSTRALSEYDAAFSKLRPVMTSAPGVYGATGIETSEAVKGIVHEVRPALVIAIDALCAREPARIASTIQLSNTGIQPGSGVGNHRAGLDEAALGVRVIAIGVPTVIRAEAFAARALAALGLDAAKTGDILKLACPDGMIVAPRDIDNLVEHASRLIAEAVSLSLNPALSEDALKWLTI